mmetsp:Transcript_32208/g.72352  ORF Transcript_32208/g.72352 Transcript_32208/m.72352 type:complete len:206 (-) Transcript_32208:218-835(-)
MLRPWLHDLCDDAADEYQHMLIPPLLDAPDEPLAPQMPFPDLHLSRLSSCEPGPCSGISTSFEASALHQDAWTTASLVNVQHTVGEVSGITYGSGTCGRPAKGEGAVEHCAPPAATSSKPLPRSTKPRRLPTAPKRPWTPEEEERFQAAMERFCKPKHDDGGVGLGQGVAEVIAFVVGTRTPAQVRSHAQKYFLKRRKEDRQGAR